MSDPLRTAKLVEIAELNPRLTESLDSDEMVSFIPMAAVDAESASTTAGEDRSYGDVSKGYTPFLDGDVLVAKITPCFENGKITQAKLSHRIGFGSTEFHVVRPLAGKADARYLMHFLRQEYIRRDGEKKMTGSAGQRRVPEHFLAGLEVPAPNLAEQRRIAEVLDRAQALRAKRRAALAQLDTLAQSIFLDLFASVDKKNWPLKTIADLASPVEGSIRTGPFGSQLLHSEFVDDGVAVLGIDNAVHNEFRWGKPRFITEGKYRELKRYTVHPGDVLITIMGTCGRCAIVPDDVPPAINTKHLCCITLDRGWCLPPFLHAYFLRHPIAKRYLDRTAKGAIMAGLNMAIIKEMPIQVAPIKLQQEFVRRSAGVETLRSAENASLSKLDDFLGTLQHHAFAGNL
jgi:type I restriction enzyme S subunit